MEIQIKDKTYTLNFGIMFLRKLDSIHYIDQKGIQIGFGLNSVVPGLLQKDAAVLSEVLYFALWTNKDRPTQKEVDEYLETEADLDQLFHDVLISLQESNVTKGTMGNFKDSLPEKDRLEK